MYRLCVKGYQASQTSLKQSQWWLTGSVNKSVQAEEGSTGWINHPALFPDTNVFEPPLWLQYRCHPPRAWVKTLRSTTIVASLI